MPRTFDRVARSRDDVYFWVSADEPNTILFRHVDISAFCVAYDLDEDQVSAAAAYIRLVGEDRRWYAWPPEKQP